VATSAEWQLRHLSLLELVQGGAAANVVREANHQLVMGLLRHQMIPVTDQHFEAARFVVQSGAAVQILQALWELPPECARITPPYLRDLCALKTAGDAMDEEEEEEEEDDDGTTTLLHLATARGAEPAVIRMILAANRSVAFVPDEDGFLLVHHAPADRAHGPGRRLHVVR
jgi:hypothetical protein